MCSFLLYFDAELQTNQHTQKYTAITTYIYHNQDIFKIVRPKLNKTCNYFGIGTRAIKSRREKVKEKIFSRFTLGQRLPERRSEGNSKSDEEVHATKCPTLDGLLKRIENVPELWWCFLEPMIIKRHLGRSKAKEGPLERTYLSSGRPVINRGRMKIVSLLCLKNGNRKTKENKNRIKKN